MPTLPDFDRSAVTSISALPPKPSGRTAQPSELSAYIKAAQTEGTAKQFPPLSDNKTDDGGPSPLSLVQRELRRAAKMDNVKIRIRLTTADENGNRILSFKVVPDSEQADTAVTENGDDETITNRRNARRARG